MARYASLKILANMQSDANPFQAYGSRLEYTPGFNIAVIPGLMSAALQEVSCREAEGAAGGNQPQGPGLH